jgi:hypothetical protein
MYWNSGLNSVVYLTGAPGTATGEAVNGYCMLTADPTSTYKYTKAIIEYGIPEFYDHLRDIGIDNQQLPAHICENVNNKVTKKHHVKKDLLLIFTTCKYIFVFDVVRLVSNFYLKHFI